MQQETVYAGFQQHREGRREQEDNGTCVEECNGCVTPAGKSYLDRWTGRDFQRVQVEGEDDRVKEGYGSNIHMGFELGMESDGRARANDE